MPLDTIGLYNKLEMARERAKTTVGSRQRLFSRDSMSVVVSVNDVLQNVKGIYTESGNDLIFTLWSDPLDVELATARRPSAGAALLAAHQDDLDNLNKIGVNVAVSKLSEARGYPKWRFTLIQNGSLESLISSINLLLE